MPPITPNGIVRPRLLYEITAATNIDGVLNFYTYQETAYPLNNSQDTDPAWVAMLKSASLMAQVLIPMVHEFGE